MFLGFRSRDLNNEGCFVGEQNTVPSVSRQQFEEFSYNFIHIAVVHLSSVNNEGVELGTAVPIRPYLDFRSKIFLKIPNLLFVAFATNGVSWPLYITFLSHVGRA
jgi:hypothetical protein